MSSPILLCLLLDSFLLIDGGSLCTRRLIPDLALEPSLRLAVVSVLLLYLPLQTSTQPDRPLLPHTLPLLLKISQLHRL